MKYIKMLGLAAIAAAAVMAFIGASTASADELTAPAGTTVKVGATLDWSLETGTSAKLVDTSGNELDKCSGSTVKGSLTANPGPGGTVAGSVSSLTWTGCTFTTTTVKNGTLSVKGGTVSAGSEFQVTINTVLFGSCIYGVTAGTSIGTLSSTGTFTANAVAEKFSGSAFACPATSKWTGSYTATEPAGLVYDQN